MTITAIDGLINRFKLPYTICCCLFQRGLSLSHGQVTDFLGIILLLTSVTARGMLGMSGRVKEEERGVSWAEVCETLTKLKMGKATGMGRVCCEILSWSGSGKVDVGKVSTGMGKVDSAS